MVINVPHFSMLLKKYSVMDKTIKDKFLFLGFNLPEDEFKEVIRNDKGMPVQTQKFGNAIIDGITQNGYSVVQVSTHPVMNFPKNKKVFFKYKKNYSGCEVGYIIPFINVLGFKHITRFLAVFFLGAKILLFTKPKYLLIHGVHSPYLIFGVLAKIIFGVKVVPIVTDPPAQIIKTDGIFTSILKSVDRAIVLSIINKFSGLIVLSRFIAEDFAPSVRSLTIEGIAGSSTMNTTHSSDNTIFSVAYTGGICREYGVETLVQAVVELNGLVELHLYGRGDYEEELLLKTEMFPFIKYMGYVEPEKLKIDISNCSVLINPRPIDIEFVKYSFPSKIIEYMLTGIPVATTRLPSIPEEYFDYLYEIPEYSVDAIKETILYLFNEPSQKLKTRSINGAEFIRKSKNPKIQGKHIIDFMKSI